MNDAEVVEAIRSRGLTIEIDAEDGGQRIMVSLRDHNGNWVSTSYNESASDGLTQAAIGLLRDFTRKPPI